MGLAADPATLDPRFLADEEGELVVGALFEPLVRLDAAGRVVPGAASRWAISDGGATFTFTLREAHVPRRDTGDGGGLRQDLHADRGRHGGRRRRSWPTCWRPSSDPPRRRRPVGRSTGVEALDDTTLRITLTEPQPRYLVTLADPSLVPTPAVADDDPEAYAVAARRQRAVHAGGSAGTRRVHPPDAVRGAPPRDPARRGRPPGLPGRSRPATGSGTTSRTACCRSPTSVRRTARRPSPGSGPRPTASRVPGCSRGPPRRSCCWGST